MPIISAIIGISIIIGCIAVFGWWGVPVLIGIYIALGILAKSCNPGKT